MPGPVGPQKAGSDRLFEGSLAKNRLKITMVSGTTWRGGPWGGPMWVAALGTPRRALGGTPCVGVSLTVWGTLKPRGDRTPRFPPRRRTHPELSAPPPSCLQAGTTATRSRCHWLSAGHVEGEEGPGLHVPACTAQGLRGPRWSGVTQAGTVS